MHVLILTRHEETWEAEPWLAAVLPATCQATNPYLRLVYHGVYMEA